MITRNEVSNLPRSLPPLHWAGEIIVIDSFSSDGTVDFLHQDSRIRIIQREFTTFADQCSFGLEHVRTLWVLSLDADYCLTPEFIQELETLEPGNNDAFYAGFMFSIYGKLLRSSLYPPRIVLFKKGAIRYEDDGHGHHAVPLGSSADMKSRIIHDDRKSFSQWWVNQQNYADQEATKLTETRFRKLPLQDKLRKLIIPASPAVAFYTLIWKLIILDGPKGWLYCLQRVIAEILLSLALIRKLLQSLQNRILLS
ncbi:MAG: glycosyltransferase family 2 protein [Verrucomicrobiota bacterium]